MKTEFAKKSYTGLPQWAQGVIAVALVGGAAYLVYKLVKAPAKLKEGQGARQEDRGWNQEFDKLNSNPATKATLSKVQMSSIANALQTAMDGYGTDYDAILRAFANVKNQADYAGVNAAFGVRIIKAGTGTGFFTTTPAMNLQAALTDELDTKQLNALNLMLAKKGVKTTS
jgi:hypothetical protein